MTLEQLRAALAQNLTDQAAIAAAVSERLGDPEDSTEVRDALDDDGVAIVHPFHTDDEHERAAELEVAEATLRARVALAEKVERNAADASYVVPDVQIQPAGAADPHDYERALGHARVGESAQLRDQARSAIEGMAADEAQRSAVLATLDLIERNTANPLSDEDGAQAAHRYAVALSSKAYRSAFAKMLAHGPSMAPAMMSDDERQAMAWASSARAAITIDNVGVSFPINIDPTWLRTGLMTRNAIRSLATVRTGTAKTHYVNTFGSATFSMGADGAELTTDGNPTGGTVEIDAELARGVLRYTISSAEDLAQLEAELNVAATRGMANLEATQMLTGNGTSPNVEGVLNGSTITRVTSGTATKLDYKDLGALVNAVPDQYRGAPGMDGPAFLGSQETFNSLRYVEDGAGNYVWTAMDGSAAEGANPSGIMGYRKAVHSGMSKPTTGVDTFTAGDDVLVFGDWADGYRVYDRVGASVEFIPHMFGTTANLPTGERGLYVRWRYGAGITNADALRVGDIG